MSQQPPIIHRVESDHEALKALHVLGQAPQLGFDTETTGLDPLKARLRLVTLAPSEHESYVFDTWALRRDGKKTMQSFFETYTNPLLAHNGKFDCKFVRAHLGVHKFNNVIDTMLGHQISSCGNLDEGFGLQDSAWQFLREQVSKAEQTSDWGRANLTDKQWEYAGSDATILHPLWAEIEQKLLGQNQRHVAQLEFDIVDAMALLELNGILLDRDRWMDIYNLASADWERLRAELQELLLGANKKSQQALFEYAPSRIINPNSYDQLIPALQAMGIPLPIDDDTGHPTTRNFKIEPLALKYYVIEVLLEYRTMQKMRSSYGLNWLALINSWTGRLHPDFHQIAALTGRMSCSDPNVQQVPIRNETYGKMFRRCFVVGPGMKMVGGDYSQFELRILADYCQDPEFMRAFRENKDLHYLSAQRIFQVPTPTDEQRGQAKNNNFAGVYGAGPTRFALMAKIEFDLAKRIMDADKRAFPKKHLWLERAAQKAVREGFSITRLGRLSRYIFDPNDQQAMALVQRNGKNSPIQGTSADALKRAIKYFYDATVGQPDDIKVVNYVHDEILTETREDLAHDVEKVLHDCMFKAGVEFVKSVPVKVDTRISNEWSK